MSRRMHHASLSPDRFQMHGVDLLLILLGVVLSLLLLPSAPSLP